MGVRNCREIGENLQKIVKRLLADDELVKLLYYTDKDPLSHENLSDEQKQKEIYEKLIRIVPAVREEEVSRSIVVVRVENGTRLSDNGEFKSVRIILEIFVPYSQWVIKDTNLRPFAILGRLQEDLHDKKVNGLGRLYGGDFELKFLTQEVSSYEQYYTITSYD